MLPDPGFLYLSKKHQMALTMLEYGLMNHAVFCVVSGETGSGKTTLLRKLLENIEPNITVGMITNTHKGFGELLDWILSAFGIHEKGLSQVDMHQRFVDFVIEQYAANKSTLLIVDEAQNMTVEKLEELRMLSNVNSEQDQVLQVILAGQPELKDTLRLPELMQFAQRISVDYHLGALSEDEVQGYIEHRLRVAGADRNIFSDDACKLIHVYSNGTPRLINLLCDTAMVYGFADQLEIIDEILVDEMVRERMADSIVPINKEALSRAPVLRKREKKPEQESKQEPKKKPKQKSKKKPKQKSKSELESKLQFVSIRDDEENSEAVSEDTSKTSEGTNNGVLTEVDKLPERRNIKTPERRHAEVKEKSVSDAIEQASGDYKKDVKSDEVETPDSGEEKKPRTVAREPVNEGVKLRGPNTIAIINPESLHKEGFTKWRIGITAAVVLVVAVVLMLGIEEQAHDEAGAISSDSGKSSEQKLVGGVPAGISDRIKQQLDEAEKFRKEFARKQQEDRERMEKLEQQTLELKKERDAAMARAEAEEKKRSKDAVAMKAANARERKARAEAERAKAEAAAIEVEKAKLLVEIQKAEIEAREKKLQEQQAMMEQAMIDQAKQAESEAEERTQEQIEQEQIEEDERIAATKKEEKRFRTDPCSSSTARFLSTCR